MPAFATSLKRERAVPAPSRSTSKTLVMKIPVLCQLSSERAIPRPALPI
jgi:hypothetical protein